LAGERARTFLHNNSIHAANAAGILFICAAAFGSFVLHHSEMGGKVRSVLLLLAAGVLLLSGLNVLSLQSKGVWVSIAASLVVLLFMLLASRRGARPWLIYLAALVGLAAGVVIFGQSIRSVGEKTAGGAAALVTRVLSGESPSLVMSSAIADPATDPSIADRLMIWANGAEVWQSHPIFGAGVTWLDNWENRIYPASTFTLLHNGYLEIAVRYGFFGLLFYGVLFAWSLITVRKAAMARLIDVSAYQAHLAVMILFAISLFTNSNNRLAFGESYMWFAASFGFYCHYLLQRQGLVRVRTYF
jgi:O-antigen ligase